MKPILYSFLVLIGFCCISFTTIGQQKVGLVLSGGGASGFAHIGVIQALEEKGIPIDYITGSSAGALVGALYAAGYSPQEIKSFVINEDFQLMSSGALKKRQEFLIREDEPTASMFQFSFSQDSLFSKSLPTKFANSTFLDFEMLKLLGTVGAQHDNDFNKLFVPFRCLASDIVSKQSVIFRSGPLNEAVRASMTFPFYFEPLRINGRLLFDGGLYNNFPADVLYKEFSPDYIIGSNVSYNADEPMEKDLISQITNMLVAYSNFELPCEEGMLIEPKLDINTFDFASVEKAIENGYQIGLVYADSIMPYVENLISKDSLQIRRNQFRSKSTEHFIENIYISAPNKSDYFIQKSLIGKKSDTLISMQTLEKRYYRLAATEQVDFIYPLLRLNDKNNYDLSIGIRKSNEWKVDLGAHISSRPVNQGYIGLTYLGLRKTALKFHGSTYFGKFYGSTHANIKIELPAFFPLTIQPYYTRNRWDYFRSFATFFEEVKPSFLVQNESYAGLKMFHPVGNNSLSIYDARYFNNEDDYYQTANFSAADTTDKSFFEGFSSSWEFKQNSLNRKQFANSGSYISFRTRYVSGRELSISGSTAEVKSTTRKLHQWVNINLNAQSFVIDKPHFHFGLQGQATFNTQSLFGNYTASLLQMTTFDLVPDAQSFFLPEYRSPLFFGGGTNLVLTFRKVFDLRFDGFLYQPLRILVQNDGNTFGYSKPFKGETFMASASLVYNSYFGPLRFSANYFPKQSKPLSLQVSFGYVIFNERANR